MIRPFSQHVLMRSVLTPPTRCICSRAGTWRRRRPPAAGGVAALPRSPRTGPAPCPLSRGGWSSPDSRPAPAATPAWAPPDRGPESDPSAPRHRPWCGDALRSVTEAVTGHLATHRSVTGAVTSYSHWRTVTLPPPHRSVTGHDRWRSLCRS